MTTPKPIGNLTATRSVYQATCSTCTWMTRKRDRADAISLLRSHNRIAHPTTEPVYLEDPA